MNNLPKSFADWLADYKNTLVHLLVSIDAWKLAVAVGLLIALWIAALRFTSFTQTERPRLSLFIRHVAFVIVWPTGIAIIATIVFFVLLEALAFCLGQQESLWIDGESHLLWIAIGAVGGATLGGGCYYWWVPGLERPSAIATLDRAPVVHKMYDPEDYFRV